MQVFRCATSMQVNTRIYAPATDRDLESSKSVSVKLERWGTLPEKGNVREIQISVVTAVVQMRALAVGVATCN